MTKRLLDVQPGDKLRVNFPAYWNRTRIEEIATYVVTGFTPGGLVVRAKAEESSNSRFDQLSFNRARGRCVGFSGITAMKVET